jgi:hypothetical protein
MEEAMTFLSTLKFTAIQDTRPSPIERRRMRLIDNLKQQLLRLNDPTLAQTRSKWVKEGQDKRLVERVLPVRPWWRELPDGRLAFFVKSGLRKVEFKKGQTAIVVENKDAMPALINGLIEAVRNGEMDQFLIDEKRIVPVSGKKVA